MTGPTDFLGFGGPGYYPSGGWLDFVAQGSSVESVEAGVMLAADQRPYDYDWFHIVDRERGEIVRSGWRSHRDQPWDIKDGDDA